MMANLMCDSKKTQIIASLFNTYSYIIWGTTNLCILPNIVGFMFLHNVNEL